MEETVFSDFFIFRTIEFHRHHYTDNRRGVPIHYFGLMLNGWARLTDDVADITVYPGDLFYIPKGCRYQSFWYSEGTVRFLSFGFRTYPASVSRSYCLQKIDCTEEERAVLNRLAENGNVSSLSVGLLYTLLGLTESHMTVDKVDRHNEIVAQAMRYMHRCSRTSAPEIARHCQISISTLYYAFRHTVKKTPLAVWHEIQTQKASEMLTATDLSVEVISDRTGFSSPSHMRRILMQNTGKTPREIRRGGMFAPSSAKPE